MDYVYKQTLNITVLKKYKIFSIMQHGAEDTFAAYQLQGPRSDPGFRLLIVWSFAYSPIHACRWISNSSFPSEPACECMHGALCWAGVRSRVYSCLVPSVPRINSRSSNLQILQIQNLIHQDELMYKCYILIPLLRLIFMLCVCTIYYNIITFPPATSSLFATVLHS